MGFIFWNYVDNMNELAGASLFGLSIVSFYVLQCLNLKREQENELEKDSKRFPQPVVDSVVTVKPLCKEDCAMAIDIWLSGLKQTSMAFPTYSRMRRALSIGLKAYAVRATSATGDMNPQAMFAEWTGSGSGPGDIGLGKKDGKCMFIAHAGGVVVGLCGVARGCTQLGDDTDSMLPRHTFSLWRMSVSPAARRLGVGAKLLAAVEDYARSNGGTQMRCVTANPLAAVFYQRLGYIVVIPHDIAPWYEKVL